MLGNSMRGLGSEASHRRSQATEREVEQQWAQRELFLPRILVVLPDTWGLEEQRCHKRRILLTGTRCTPKRPLRAVLCTRHK